MGGGGRGAPPVPGLSGGSGGLPPGPPRGGSGPGRPTGAGAVDDLILPPLRPVGGGGGRGPWEENAHKVCQLFSIHTWEKWHKNLTCSVSSLLIFVVKPVFSDIL